MGREIPPGGRELETEPLRPLDLSIRYPSARSSTPSGVRDEYRRELSQADPLCDKIEGRLSLRNSADQATLPDNPEDDGEVKNACAELGGDPTATHDCVRGTRPKPYPNLRNDTLH